MCRRWRRLGVKTADVDLRFWFGIFGPKGMPDAVRAKLEKAVRTTPGESRGCANAWPSSTSRPDFAPGAAMRVKLENEITNWTKFIDAHGIKSSNKPDKKNEAGVSAGYDFVVNGRSVHVDTDGSDAAAVGAARRSGPARQPVRLRHRAVRRLHGADRRQAGIFLRARSRHRRRTQHHDGRGPVARRRAAPVAAGVPRRAGRPVRLLPRPAS